MRGKNNPSNKITEEDIQSIRDHILSIPTYESHYTRRDSSLENIYHPITH